VTTINPFVSFWSSLSYLRRPFLPTNSFGRFPLSDWHYCRMDCGRLGLCLPAGHLRRLAADWLSEDCPTLDVGGYIVGDKVSVAQLKCKQPCLLAGRPFFDSIFEALECTVEWRLDEGSEIVQIPQIVADISGPTRNLLLGERPALNLLR